MPVYDVHSMLVSLNIQDTPLSYNPPIGPEMRFKLTYNQREVNQPANFGFSNVGQKWTFNNFSYIQDDPNIIGTNVMRVAAGGGAYHYSNYNTANGNFLPERKHGAILVYSSGPSVSYERQLRNGSKEIYSHSDGSLAYPRRIFLTQRIDPQGNSQYLNYDALLRLTSITDALGQEMTYSYTNPNDNLLITEVSGPFGRSAQLSYDNSGRINSITDAIGMISSFTYDNGSFITSMKTQYGTTQFDYGETGTTRWLDITDPKGNTERTEYKHDVAGLSNSETIVPFDSNLITYNQYLNYRNTFYWDKRANKLAPGDYTKAEIKHWVHQFGNINITEGILESVKRPFENRVWFNYPNQAWAGTAGDQEQPIAIARVLDQGQTQVTYKTYNSLGKITSRTDPLGRITTYEYSTDGIDLLYIKQKTTTGFDVLSEITYNQQHQPLTKKDAAGNLTQYSYNTAGQLLSLIDPEDKTTSYEYDNSGYLIDIINTDNVVTHHYTYDSFGRKLTLVDRDGYILSFEYDALNRLTKITHPDSSYQEIIWDKLDISQKRDRFGKVTNYNYDSVRNLLTVIDPSLRPITMTHDENGDLLTVTDKENKTTSWIRDIQARVTEIKNADGASTFLSYENTTSRLKRRTDSLGQVKQYSYTLANELKSETSGDTINPVVSIKNYKYDSIYPRVDTIEDDNNVITKFGYDAQQRVISRTQDFDGLELDTQDASNVYDYDVYNNLTGVTDSINGHTQYTYDNFGNISQQSSPDAGTVTLSHNARYNVISKTDSKGQIFSYLYDFKDRIKTITSPTVNDDIIFQYDNCTNGIGFLCSITQGSTTVTYDYNTAGDVVNHQNIQYSYDSNGRLSSYTLPSGNEYKYIYNLVGQIESVNSVINGVTQILSSGITYTSFDLMTALTYGNGAQLNQSWNSDRQLTQQKIPNIETRDYNKYDSNGNLLSQTKTSTNTSQSYSYDALNQLTTSELSSGSLDYVDFRINVGGPDYIDPQGRTWLADRNFSGGNSSTTPISNEIQNTEYDFIYQQQRWGTGIQYEFFLPNGNYEVRIHTAEAYAPAFSIGKRVFNVDIQNQSAILGIDIYSSV
jgi:YD repeat-containing protein